MKALSLWQPWASLLVSGHKRVETRGWPLRHRGPLLIHAARYWSAEISATCIREPFKDALESVGVFHPNPFLRPKGLSFGAIVGRVDINDCLPTERVGRWEQTPDEPDLNYFLDQFGVMGPGDGKPYLFVSDVERAFGDYSPDRFAITTTNPVRFDQPIHVKGRQGLFSVPDEMIPEEYR